MQSVNRVKADVSSMLIYRVLPAVWYKIWYVSIKSCYSDPLSTARFVESSELGVLGKIALRGLLTGAKGLHECGCLCPAPQIA